MQVLKFGGTSVGSSKNIKKVISIIVATALSDTIICVVSAIGGITDKLLQAGILANNKDLSSVMYIIDENINSSDDWKMFEKAFNNADKKFFKKVVDLIVQIIRMRVT